MGGGRLARDRHGGGTDAHYGSRDNSRPQARAGVRALTNLVGPVVGPVGFEPTLAGS